MRFVTALCFGVAAAAAAAAAALAAPAFAQDDDEAFRLYAVHINRTPKQPWIGYGIYLGNGVVITAAHVAGLGFWRRPRVEIGGENYPTGVLKDGHFHAIDLTLLSVDVLALPVSLGLRRTPLCRKAPQAGEPVVVATPEGVARSKVMSRAELPPHISAEYSTAIKYVAGSGDSGSGVFDANRKCLLGIITRKIMESSPGQDEGSSAGRLREVAKYFIPAEQIADFIPATVRF